MNASPRGRAMVARVRRPLAWALLCALGTLNSVGALSPASSVVPTIGRDESARVVRATLLEDILDELFGTPDDPPPPPPEDPPPPPPDDPW